jgi:hypothetical protein
MKSFRHDVGSIFQPIFHVFGWMLAFCYGPGPELCHSHRHAHGHHHGRAHAVHDQEHQVHDGDAEAPARDKEACNRSTRAGKSPDLNEEMMKLYKRGRGQSPRRLPARCCCRCPSSSFFTALLRVWPTRCLSAKCPEARCPVTSRQAQRCTRALVLRAVKSRLLVWISTLKAFSVHSSFAAHPVLCIRRGGGGPSVFPDGPDEQSKQEERPLQCRVSNLMMQRFLPVIFAYFYLVIPAAVVLYMIISTIIRIITQDLMFRAGVSNPNKGVPRFYQQPRRNN